MFIDKLSYPFLAFVEHTKLYLIAEISLGDLGQTVKG